MPTPSAQLALPAIAGTDTPDVPRDLNAVITALEANTKYFATRDVLAVGQVGQTVAGRTLLPADFTDLGLAIPTAIYNLDSVTDTSGNALNLTNKGTVPFTTGVTGAASEAALLVGSTSQGFYRVDSGGADPFRFKTCSVGCWYKTSKRGATQYVLSKSTTGLTDREFALGVDSPNTATFQIATVGAAGSWQNSPFSITDCCDDRWHFIVGTFDANRIRIYVDGALEASLAILGALNPSAGPVNIGGYGMDASTVSGAAVNGKVQAAFFTPDVLTEEQIRALYAIKLVHSMTRTPRRAGVAIQRRKRGAILVPGDFPATPNRIYNLDDLLDDSGNAVALTANAGTGTINSVAGPDGTRSTARHYVGTHNGDSATDAALPTTTATRSIGAWFKTSYVTALQYIIAYGSTAFALSTTTLGQVQTTDGVTNILSPYVADGEWHHAVFVGDNAAADGFKTKLYLDGRLVGTSANFNATVLGGATSFRIGALPAGTSPFQGSIARGFVSPTALTCEQILTLFNKATLNQGVSPKEAGPHIERLDATNALFVGDVLEPQDRIDLELRA